MYNVNNTSTRAQISGAALQRLYIAMRHLFIRGSYKPLGVSGEALLKALMQLKPEIYGNITDPERLELDGLQYVFQRLPRGIEECRYIRLISREGFEKSFEAIVPSKRRRNCYRIDKEQFYIEMTRGRSDIYDVLTHLSFMYIEAEKIKNNALGIRGRKIRDWSRLEEIIERIDKGEDFDQERGYTYLSTLIGRTYDETKIACKKFENTDGISSLFNIVYWLGYHSIQEEIKKKDREISFSVSLRENIGHHLYGEQWAEKIKRYLLEQDMIERPIHIISSNLHSVMNCFYAKAALQQSENIDSLLEVAEELSIGSSKEKRKQVVDYALENGMSDLFDDSGTNLGVQIFDCKKMNFGILPSELNTTDVKEKIKDSVIVVMDYAFGEQAYECMDELLKPLTVKNKKYKLDIASINIMGKAGILDGRKGDIMIPNAHIFEGSADNYPFENQMTTELFDKSGLEIYHGPMITVLGTSLQNKDILRYFHKSSWKCIGLEMEGAHYQKAIQAASQVRGFISKNVDIRYAYYASDNPLETGATLSSGALGKSGVKPTYLITLAFLNGILTT